MRGKLSEVACNFEYVPAVSYSVEVKEGDFFVFVEVEIIVDQITVNDPPVELFKGELLERLF